MFVFFYSLGLYFYRVAIQIASLFNEKAALWVKGRKGIWKKIEALDRGTGKLVWFHAASLGEFEQGRPVIEELKKREPQTRILLTFFSPSGYEIRKNYPGADFIFYLPLDTNRNARRFVELFKPDAVVFIKYEFWYHYLNRLNRQHIPVYLISAIFRSGQPFFKPWGKLYRKMLGFFSLLFVQDEESVRLLHDISIDSVIQNGDTRFDRVAQVAAESREIEQLNLFMQDLPGVVCGSSWPGDENIILQYINRHSNEWKWVIVPHEIGEAHLREIEMKCEKPAVRYSKLQSGKEISEQVLIVDTIGLLSSIYRYGKIAYIGGGFGHGIHNTLEAAVYGMPVIFGPNYTKFKEAVELVARGGAFVIHSIDEFEALMDSLTENRTIVQTAGQQAADYVSARLGATTRIVDRLVD